MFQLFIVEDHADVCETYLALIEEEPDLRVCGTAPDGRTALAQVPLLKPDLLLLDLSLPDMNGFDLLEHLRAVAWQGPVLLVSGHPARQYESLGQLGGAAGYVDKMEAHLLLIDKIREVLSHAPAPPDEG